MKHYKNYIGQFVKRFYQPFEKEYIYKISDFRIARRTGIKGNEFDFPEFNYGDGSGEDFWCDCEDSCIITNEIPILNIDWVANVNDDRYKGFNPFSQKEQL